MRKNTILLTIFMMVSKVLGILRESVLSYFYGAGIYTDAYNTANLIPTVAFGIVATGLVSTFIPIYSRIYLDDGEKRADEYLNNIMNIIFVLTIILTGLGLMFTEELVWIFAKGFTGKSLEVTVMFTRVSLFAILFTGIFNIMNGYHQYHNRFLVSPISGFIMNFVIITSIIISGKTSPLALAYGITIAAAAQALFSYLVARNKAGYKFKLQFDLKDPYLKPMLVMAVPIILGSSINHINTIIDRRIASDLMTGAISILNYGSKISDSIYGLFVTTITTVMYPTLTKQAASNDLDSMKKTVIKIMTMVFIIIIPLVIGLMTLADPVTNLFYGRGEFKKNPAALVLTSQTLFFYAIGTVGYSLRDVLTRTFYAMHDSFTPVISGIIAVAVNLGLNLYFAPRYGVPGLALATSLSALVSVALLYVSLHRKLPGIGLKQFTISAMKTLFSGLLMALLVYLVYYKAGSIISSSTIRLFVSVAVGAVTYIGTMYFMKIPEFDETLDIILSKIK
ncbi:murein biosynthesis integral membrane protein MurJ [Erysipelothrix urinaevulpis]|uniref:murein biosynthesis integral membrane protein MurJ n=1 Tax=Erysipelothrix urinaevulpis TaxID=2683717 RepID=UPI00135B2B62|nr:murein biosynthesis integral membrane protein MurJ [Erysipelothrix urinaevulpis]